MKFHYVYRISNLLLDKHYYGKRSTHLNPIDDIGKVYFSSSNKQFIQDQINNPENYKYKIIKTFETSHEAIAFETKLQIRVDAAKNPRFYNKMIYSHDFNSEGKMLACDKDGNNKVFISKDDDRLSTGELVGYWTICVSVCEDGKNITIKKTDPRYNVTLFSRTRGTALVKDANGSNYRVKYDDPRILNGTLLAHAKNMHTVYDENGKTIRVSVEDDRYISIFRGTAVFRMPDGTNKRLKKDLAKSLGLSSPLIGTVSVKDANGMCYRVRCDDERLISGELTYVSKNMSTVRDSNGNMFQLHKDDPRIKSGDVCSIRKGSVKVLDFRNGKKYTTNDNNPLLATMEIIPTSKNFRCIAIDKEGFIFCTNIFDSRFSTGEIRRHNNKKEICSILSDIRRSCRRK